VQDEWNRYICYYCGVLKERYSHDDPNVYHYDGRSDGEEEDESDEGEE
jgi:hypothetical protein